MKKRVFCFLLALTLILGILPAGVLAADSQEAVLSTGSSPEISAFPSFRGRPDNNGITAALTPRNAEEAKLAWNIPLETPSPVILAEGSLYTMTKTELLKLNPANGLIRAKAQLIASPSYSTTPPCYGDGKIFCQLNDANIQAFDAKTLKLVWSYHDPVLGTAEGEGAYAETQCISPITYADGKLYVGVWKSPAKPGGMLCLDGETGERIWREKISEGCYWAGPVVVGDYLICGDEQGRLNSWNKDTGKPISKLDAAPGSQIRSAICYADGKVYCTSTDTHLIRADLDPKTGKLSNLKTADFKSFGMQSTTTPVVYRGMVYFAAGAPSRKSGNTFLAVNADTLKPIWTLPVDKNPQASPLLSTAYEDAGYLYFYFTCNCPPGGMSVVQVKTDGTEPRYSVLHNPVGHEQYCICSAVCDADGSIYYKNDSGWLFKVSSTDAARKQQVNDRADGMYQALRKTVKPAEAGTEAGDFAAIGRSRAGRNVSPDYYRWAETAVRNGNLNVQETARLILALHAVGMEADRVAGTNLFDRLNSGNPRDTVWSFLALNSYPDYPDTGLNAARRKMAAQLIQAQEPNGSWENDPSLTALALIGLSSGTEISTETAIQDGLDYLSVQQKPTGGFADTKTTALTVIALTSLNMDPAATPSFVKNGHSVLEALCRLYVPGGFLDAENGKKTDAATALGFCALVSRIRIMAGNAALLDMRDMVLLPYADIPCNEWYRADVRFMTDTGLMIGNGKGFAPEEELTREQMVMVLYRLADTLGFQPVSSGTMKFGDVPESSYAWDAIIWATENGITVGTAPGKFSPNRMVTREEMTIFLYRFAREILQDPAEERASLDGFTDTDQLHDYALAPMGWAVSHRIVQGTTPTTLSPENTIPRCQTAAMVHRFFNLFAGD